LSSLIEILPSVMCSDRNVIGLTGSMPSDAHWAGVGTKRAVRLAWLETSVSGERATFGPRPSCVSSTMTTAATARTATTATTAIARVWRSIALAY
jgi:hypothetical protein